MNTRALTLEEVSKRIADKTIGNIWYAEMDAVLGCGDEKFVALRPLLYGNILHICDIDTVFFEIIREEDASN